MERRDSERRHRRVNVRFWKRGDARPSSGFTTNISESGMFIATVQLFPPGTRLRVEVQDTRLGFIVEGVVARSFRPSPILARMTPAGMGVRFLSVGELVGELFPVAAGGSATSRSAAPEAPAGSPPPPTTGEPTPPRPPAADPAAAAGRRMFTISFPDAADLRTIFDRDISQGGLFVTTAEPADLNEVVVLTIAPPGAEPVQLLARVVHRVEPDGGSGPGSSNLLAGMGVEFLDREAAVAALAPFSGA